MHYLVYALLIMMAINSFQGLAGELINVLREANQVVPESLLKFGTHVKKKVRHNSSCSDKIHV